MIAQYGPDVLNIVRLTAYSIHERITSTGSCS